MGIESRQDRRRQQYMRRQQDAGTKARYEKDWDGPR